MRPTEVLDKMNDLTNRASHPEYVAWVGSSTSLSGSTPRERANLDEFGQHVIRALPTALRAGYAYRVTPDMCALLEVAARSLDDTDRANHELAPSTSGFVRLDTPLSFKNLRGYEMLVNYIVWLPCATRRGKPGVVVLGFNDYVETPDDHFRQWMKSADPRHVERTQAWMGRWMLTSLESIADGDEIGALKFTPPSETQEAIRRNMATDGERVWEDIPDEFNLTDASNLARYTHALWLLLGQTIVDVRSEQAQPRQARRRFERVKLPSRVCVVELRRRKNPPNPDAEHSPVNWQHQWMVKAHWRWAPCGKRKGVEHEHTYGMPEVVAGVIYRYCQVSGCDGHLTRTMIHEYVKGPPGRPLFISSKVYDLRR